MAFVSGYRRYYSSLPALLGEGVYWGGNSDKARSIVIRDYSVLVFFFFFVYTHDDGGGLRENTARDDDIF